MGLFSKGRSRSSSLPLEPGRAAQLREEAAALALRGWENARGGEWGEAARHLERAAETMRPTSGPEDMEFARLLNNWANALQMDGRLDQALPLYAESIAIKRAALGDGHAETLGSLRNLLAALEASEDWAKAAETSSAIVECLETSGREGEPEHLFALEKTATLRSKSGDDDDAEQLRSIAARHALERETPNRLDMAVLLEALAQGVGQSGDEAAAEALLGRALEVREAWEGRRTEHAGRILHQMAHHALALGDRATARNRFAEVLEIRLEKLGPKHPDAIDSMNNLAGLFLAEGESARAFALFERVLRNRMESLGVDHPDSAYAFNNLAGACWAIGDLERASELYEAFRRRIEEIEGRRHPFWAIATANLGKLALDRGDPSLAKSALEEAIRHRLENENEESPEIARTWETLADAHAALGEFDQALETRRRALDARRKTQGELHPAHLGSLFHLAALLQTRGAMEEAESVLREAMRWTEASLGPQHSAMVLARGREARLRLALGDSPTAAALARSALDPEQTRLGAELPFLPTIRRRAALAEIQRLLRLLVDADDALDDYEWIARWKGIDGSSARARRLASKRAETRDAVLRLQNLRDQIERVRRGTSAISEDQLETMEAKAAEWEAALARETGWRGEGPDLATLLNSLPEGWAILDWVRGDRRYAVFVIQRGSGVRRIHLEDAPALDRLIAEWCEADSGSAAQAVLERLSAMIAEPLAEPLRGVRGLAIVPDGKTAALPWLALRWEERQDEQEIRELVLLDSVREWMENEADLQKTPRSERTRGSRESLLISGATDPQSTGAVVVSASPIARFDPSLGEGQTAVLQAADLDPSPLAGSERFAEELSAISERHPKSVAIIKRLGAQASRIGVLAALPESRDFCLLHRIAVKPPLTSSPDPADPLWSDGQTGRWFAALVCSGAAELATEPLTGMIEVSAAVIEADDIAKLDLSESRLAILIAPAGAQGAEGAAELARAFRSAGVRQTLLGLHNDRGDESALLEILRQVFAFMIEDGQSPSSALRTAFAQASPELAARAGWGLWVRGLEAATLPRAPLRLEYAN